MTSALSEQPANGRPFVISIVGPSASGKSQLAKCTATELGDPLACRIPTDYFFIPRDAGQPLTDFLRQPLQSDWPLIAQPIATAVSTPEADFSDFRRIADSGGRPFTIRPVMIVDAMAAFPHAALLVRLDVADDVRRERLRERDARWGSHVLANWGHLNVTWEAALKEMHGPDLTLAGERAITANAGVLATEIRARLTGHK